MVLILSLAWRTLLLMSPIALPSETIGLCCGYGVQPDLLGVFNQKLCSFLRLFCFRVLPFILPLVLSRLALPSLSFGLRSLLRSLLLRLRSLPLEMVINGQTFILESFQTTYIAWYMYMYFTVHMIYIYIYYLPVQAAKKTLPWVSSSLCLWSSSSSSSLSHFHHHSNHHRHHFHQN